ncbi:MAG: hypothetical protein R3A79_21170 [Nannocystaceae bacterium]
MAAALAACAPSKAPERAGAGERTEAGASVRATSEREGDGQGRAADRAEATTTTTTAGTTEAEHEDAASEPALERGAAWEVQCAADRGRGEAWIALDVLLGRSSIGDSFVGAPLPRRFACPPRFELVQRRPWVRDTLASEPETLGELYEFVGRDAGSGDVILATLGRVDAVSERDGGGDLRELDQRAYFRVVPEEPSRPLALLGDGLEPGRWYSLRFAARSPGTVAALAGWLREHPGEVVDVVRLAPDDRERRGALLHRHAGTTVTICPWGRGARPCWTRDDVVRSALTAEGEYGVDLELTLRGGSIETWRVDDALALHPGEGATTGLSAWREADRGAPTTAAILGGLERLRTLRPGYVAVGHYAEIGHATIHRAPVTDWILREDGGAWAAIPTPELVLHDLIPLESALAVVEARQLITAASVEDSLRVLGFAATADGWGFVGQLPPIVGEDTHSPIGRYTWRHSLEVAGDACLRLGPGPYEGVTADPETETEADVGPRARRRLKATRGPWTIAADGIRRGCARAPADAAATGRTRE